MNLVHLIFFPVVLQHHTSLKAGATDTPTGSKGSQIPVSAHMCKLGLVHSSITQVLFLIEVIATSVACWRRNEIG